MRRTTINLTEATDRQIEYLKERGFGSFTQIVRLAVDRMYRKEANTMSNSPNSIARYVVEQGRVVGDPQSKEWLESLEIEVEFEARERGLPNSMKIAKRAVVIYRQPSHQGFLPWWLLWSRPGRPRGKETARTRRGETAWQERRIMIRLRRYKQGSICFILGQSTFWYKPWRPWKAKARKWIFRKRYDLGRFTVDFGKNTDA